MTVFPNMSGINTPNSLKDSVSHLALKSAEIQQLTVQISGQVNNALSAQRVEDIQNYTPPTQAANNNENPEALAA